MCIALLPKAQLPDCICGLTNELLSCLGCSILRNFGHKIFLSVQQIPVTAIYMQAFLNSSAANEFVAVQNPDLLWVKAVAQVTTVLANCRRRFLVAVDSARLHMFIDSGS